MGDYTEITNENWFGRIAGSIKGVVIGIIMILIAFVLLFWNEGRAVKRYKTLKEGAASVISISLDKVNPQHDGKLIHVTGAAKTDEELTDPIFKISKQALRLKRSVEMFQWVENKKSETKKKLGGGTTTTTKYTYKKRWNSSLVSSSSFKKESEHKNPAEMLYKSKEWNAKRATIGDFDLTTELIKKMTHYNLVIIKKIPSTLAKKAMISGEYIYVGKNPSSPSVGDMRIRISMIPPSEISLIAKQYKKTFEAYQTKAGGSILLLEEGKHSADLMIQKAVSNNKMLTLILRFAGFLLMFFGFLSVFKPLSVVADVVPFIGSLVGVGTGIVAFLLSFILSSITIAIAWIVYRPLLGVSLLIVAGLLLFFLKKKFKKSANK